MSVTFKSASAALLLAASLPCCRIAAANDQCADAIEISCGATIHGDTSGATTDGVWPCAAGGSDVWYSFVATETIATVSLCDSSYDTSVMILDGCGGTVLGCNDDSCALQSRLMVSDLAVGNSYLIAVGGYNGSVGAFIMELSCGASHCDAAHAQPGDIEENEVGDCGYDSFNGGCNSNPPVYSPIECGQSVHGTSGTNDAIGYRDTDWWRFRVNSRISTVYWSVTAEFPVQIGFVRADCSEADFIEGTMRTAPACTEVWTWADLCGGDYVAFVAPTRFSGVPCGSEYRGDLSTCWTLPPNADNCGDALAINCGEMVFGRTTCQTTDGSWPCAEGGNEVWYSFIATDIAARIDVCAADFDTAVMVLDGCGGDVLGCNDNACGAQSVLDVSGLAVGHRYLIAVGGASGAAGRFAMVVSCFAEPSCALPHAFDIEEHEPSGGCADDYVDAFNGGCDSTPPGFTSVNCGETVHGGSGTFLLDGTPARDSDWWYFPVLSRRRVTWTVNADFPALIAIYGMNCPNPLVVGASSGPACDPLHVSADLPRGGYAAYVAPADPFGVACGAQYRGTLNCEEICTGDVNQDGLRDLSDLAALLSEFGSLEGVYAGDLDGDGDVDLSDLGELLSVFGTAC